MELSKEQLNELYKKLPPEMRSVEFTERASDAIRASAEKNKLSPEQTHIFARIIWETIVGAIPQEKLSERIATVLSLQPEQAQKIAADVEQEIFSKMVSPARPLPKGEYPKRSEGEGVSPAEKTPLRLAGSAPPLTIRAGEENKTPPPTPPRPVPITKIPPPPPPRQNLGQAPTTYSLQTILADIRRGTAYDEKRISDAFHKTPIEVRQTLESVGFLSRLQNIAKKFGLNVEETGELVSESGLVMLGLTQPSSFVENLAKRLRLPRDRAMAVGQAVNMEVLRPVREILKKMTQPQPANPTLPQSQENGLRFAPTTSSIPNIPRPSGTPFQGGIPDKSSLEGGVRPKRTEDVSPPISEVKKYTTDPYREPIE